EGVIGWQIGEVEIELAAAATLHHASAFLGFHQNGNHGGLDRFNKVGKAGLGLCGLGNNDLSCRLHLCSSGLAGHDECGGYPTNAHQHGKGRCPQPTASTRKNSRAHEYQSPSASPQQLVGYIWN